MPTDPVFAAINKQPIWLSARESTMNDSRSQDQQAQTVPAHTENSLASAMRAEQEALEELLARYREFSRLRSVLWHANRNSDHITIEESQPQLRAAEDVFRRARRLMGEAMFSTRLAKSTCLVVDVQPDFIGEINPEFERRSSEFTPTFIFVKTPNPWASESQAECELPASSDRHSANAEFQRVIDEIIAQANAQGEQQSTVQPQYAPPAKIAKE